MAKKITLAMLMAFLILPFLACKKKGEKPVEILETGVPAGDLHVSFVSPQGQTSALTESETVAVIFDQPMVPLEALPDGTRPSLIKFEPSISGKYRWLNSKTLVFTPSDRFPLATEIKASIPAGARSLQGFTLTEDYIWSFKTIRPKVISHFPQNDQKWLGPETQVLLVFNQAVDKDKARDFLNFKEASQDGAEREKPFILKTASPKLLEEQDIKSPAEETLLLEPEEKLARGMAYLVRIIQGFPGKEGPLGTERDYSFRFETYQDFKLEAFDAGEDHNPNESLRFQFSNPVVYSELVKAIRFEPEVAIPDYYEEWNDSNSTLWLSLPLQPETKYAIQISSDLKDEFGNRLGKDSDLAFSTSSYPASFSMNTGIGILEAYSDLRFPLYTVNTREIFAQAARVGKEDAIPLLNIPNIFWSKEKFTRKNFFRVEKTLRLDLLRNKREIIPLNLKEDFPENFGIIFLQLDTFLEDEWIRYPKAFLQVTNLGLSTKFSPENNLVWVTELKTGKAVPEARVEVRDDSNRVLWKGKTDEKGMAQTPGWKALGLKSKDEWSKPRQWVFASRDEDLALISSEWGTGIYPYRFGIDYDWNPQPVTLQGYIFTDRGIYRAGEKVHIKGIIRKMERGEWRIPGLKQAECEVQDPFQKNIFSQKLDLDSFGSFAFDLETNPEASLGYYQIRATLPPETKGEKATTFYSSFRVEAFRPAEFEVHLRSLEDSFTFGDEYEAEVRATYLFGGALASQKVTWHLRLNPASFTPPGHEAYTFGNQVELFEREGQEDSRLLSSGEALLDKEGKFKVSAMLRPEKETDSVLAVLEVTVEDPGRRSISNRIQTLVHRGDYYLGLKPHTTFLSRGKSLAVNVISVDSQGELLSGKKVTLKLLKRDWVSVRKSEIGGRFRWVSERKDTEIASQAVVTKTEPQQVSFSPEKAGFYLLYAEGKDSRGNLISTTTYFYVTGKDYIPWERRDDDTVELVADRSAYHPGETAKILVKSPYEKALALVTLEREFILENRVLEIAGSSSEVEIPILSEHLPNVFVSVLLVQGRTSPQTQSKEEDLGKPSFKIGYLKLNVDPSEKRLSIAIHKHKKAYKPGEEITLEVNVLNSKGLPAKSSLSLAVVDVGVLNLIGFQTPDPFSEFYSHKPLAVETSDSRPFVVGQLAFGEKGEDVGGGVGERLMAAAPSLAEVELRGKFKTTAYWNPSLLTDEEGRASVRFTLPDNLTTFRIMAVAQTVDSCFGRAQETFRVSKPLLLRAALPRFARVGDEFQGGLIVHNHSEKQGEVTLSCQASGISLLDKNITRRLALAPGEGKEALFLFKVEKAGEAAFEFRAVMGEETDGLRITLPLKMPRPAETVALAGESKETVEEKVKIPEDAYLEESMVEFTGAASALVGLKGSVDDLTDYPYLCLEQRLSSILPYLVAKEIILEFKLSRLNEREIEEHVKKNLKEIYSYQKDSGGFGLWPDSFLDSPFISCYTAFTLAKAIQADFTVEKQVTDRLISYLQALIRGRVNKKNYPYEERTWKTVEAFALYCLALFNSPEPSYAEKLFTDREVLSLLGKTLLLKALNQGQGSIKAQNALLQELLNKAKVSPTTAHFEDDEGREGGWIYSSNTRTTALILQSLLESGFDHPLLSPAARWLVEKRKAASWSTTQDNFFAFYALNDFYCKYESAKPDFKVKVRLEQKLLLEDLFRERNKVAGATTSLEAFKPGKIAPLKVQLDGEGTFYYQARMTYTPKSAVKPRDEGIGITKEISSLDGKPLGLIKAGTLVVVTLRVIVPQERLFVVIDDPLPAGLEAVNPTFQTESEEEQQRLEALEESLVTRWWQGFNHLEMHDDRVLLFADSLKPGIHTHRYLARALTFGTFQAPGAKGEEMYSPEIFGRSPELTVKIVR